VVEPRGPLALTDALALALMSNPELQMFSWETRAAEARALQAGLPRNPEVDVRMYRLGRDRQNVLEDTKRTRVVLSQVFQLGGKRRKRARLAETEHSLAEWDYEDKRGEVAAGVAGEFVAVVGAQRRVEALRRHVEFFEQTQSKVAALVETGAVGSLETHRMARRVGLARIELQRVESELAVARFRLAATWGSPSPRFTEAVGDIDQVKPIPDLDTVIELAREGPAIARWGAEHARGEAALALAKAGRVPDLTYGAGVRWQEKADGEDYLIDVEIALPLFDRNQGAIREAHYEMARAEAGRKAAEAAGSVEIAEIYYAVTESEARIATLASEVLPAARASVEAFRIVFERAADNLGDLLDARRDLARAEVDHTDALVDYHRALTRLEGRIGQGL
jgi:cobalt-zinc-cadmium efflux system outer membrane protein